MQGFTITQWAIVALVFIAGWLLGLASRSGGKRWRERYATERDAHAAYRSDADARVAAAEERYREIERDHARLAAAAPVTAATVAPNTTGGTTVVSDGSRPVETVVIRPGETTRRL